MKSSKSKLWILMITAFIDMVGLLMVLPLLPFYAKSLGQGGLIVGLLVSSFAVAQLLTAPMWGRLSDAYGRRPAMLVGLTASAIAYIIFAFALELPHALFWLFLCRIVQGAGGGTVSVIQAYVADATRPEERAKALGWLSAATNAGVAIGPVLGSLTHAWGPRGPGLFAAVLCFGNIIFAWKYLDESRDMHEAAESKADTTKRARSRDAVLRVVTHSAEPASRLIWIYAIALGAFQGVTSMLALYLSARFYVTANSIGFFFAYTGVISVLTRALILGKMVDRYGEVRLSRFGLVLLAAGIAAMAFTKPISDPARVAAMFGGVLPTAAVAFLPYLPLALAVALVATRHRVHLSVRDGDAVTRHLEQGARLVHGRAADVRGIGARDLPRGVRHPVRRVPAAAVPAVGHAGGIHDLPRDRNGSIYVQPKGATVPGTV